VKLLLPGLALHALTLLAAWFLVAFEGPMPCAIYEPDYAGMAGAALGLLPFAGPGPAALGASRIRPPRLVGTTCSLCYP